MTAAAAPARMTKTRNWGWTAPLQWVIGIPNRMPVNAMKPLRSITLVAASLFAAPTFGQFTPGNLAVLRVGDGTPMISGAAAAVSIEQYSVLGEGQSPSYTVALPTTGASAITLSGTAASEGALTRSADGMYLTFAGYNADVGTLSVSSTTSAMVNRAVGVLDAAGAYSLPVKTANAFSGASVCGAVTTDGAQFWITGNGNSGTGGVWAKSSSTETQVTSGNLRVVGVEGGNLLYSTGAGTVGLYAFSGLPTSADTASLLIKPASSFSNRASPYDFALNPAGNVAYLADDRTFKADYTGGGIQRWEKIGSTWSLTYSLNAGGTGGGSRGLVVDWSGANPVIFATTTELSANRLIRIEDLGAGSSATTLAIAPANTLFRGVDFSPIPEPQTLTLLGLGGAGLFLRLRRRA